MRLLKWKWIHEQQHSQPASHGGELSFSAFRRARRSSRRSRMTKEEYLRLKQMVPAVATQVRVSKVWNEPPFSPAAMYYYPNFSIPAGPSN